MVAAVLLLACFADTFLTGLLLVKHQALVEANKVLAERVACLDHEVSTLSTEMVNERMGAE